MKRDNVFKIIGAVIFAAVTIALFFVYKEMKEEASAGTKNISVAVIYENGARDEYDVGTKEEYLKGVLDELPIEYDMDDGMVMVINGIRADYNLDGAYWCFYVNGQMCNFGIEEQAVFDGDGFEIVYTKA